MELRVEPFSGDARLWDAWVSDLPGAHLLQTWEWAQVKAQYGWEPRPMVWWGAEPKRDTDNRSRPSALAMVLKRQLTVRGAGMPMGVMYVPKGPLLEWSDAMRRETVLADLERLARKSRAIFVKIDPDIPMSGGLAGEAPLPAKGIGTQVAAGLGLRGWVRSQEQIQFRNTIVLDLGASEDELLARMKQKTRYNIRLATRKGVRVRPVAAGELPTLYRMYAETSQRDGFAIRNQAYYEHVWGRFLGAQIAPEVPSAACLVAEVEGETAAAVFVFFFADRAYYLYGMSRTAHRDKMPNHLLQWEAIKLARRRGCDTYDFWGAPDEFNEGDSLWGVYRFKEGFGGEVVRTPGAWDFPAHRLAYQAYVRAVPRVLDFMRWLGRRRVREDLLAA